MLQAVDFWLGLGVDGLRLDAVPYLFEREGTNCENLPETHGFLRKLRSHVDQGFKNRMLLAEANQWPEDASAYFGDGDECHMAYHFPLMPRLFMAIRVEDRFPIVEILQQTPPIPENSQWALFLRNHDELTLEMVTDEERDYMYRVYSQDPQAQINLGIRRRLAPLLGNNRRRIELMNGLLFSLSGTVVIYYGDELGMGDNIYLGDRNGVRTPMQWSGDRNAGFSQANPQRLFLPVIIDPEYHYETVNAETQKNNPSSLFWWTKRLIALRKRFKAFSRGTMEFIQPENRKVLAFVRRNQDECILVVANLSRFVQGAEVDLSEFKGRVPVELFGQTSFPAIGEQPYFLTLGPHSFYWFSLEPQRDEVSAAAPETQAPSLTLAGSWQTAFTGSKAALEAILPGYLRTRHWFAGKARTIQAVQVQEAFPIPERSGALSTYLTLLRADYTEGESEVYLLPLAYASGEQAERVLREAPQAAIARITMRDQSETGVLYDGLWEQDFCTGLLEAIARRRRFKGPNGEVQAWPARAFRRLRGNMDDPLEPSLPKAEQSNTSLMYGSQFILKLFRRVQPGTNPDLEVGHFLTEKAGFAHTPPVAGAIEYRSDREQPLTLSILHGYIVNQGDAWEYTLDALTDYFEQVMARPARETAEAAALPSGSLVRLAGDGLPPLAYKIIGAYLQSAELLGRRTAELHLALSSDTEDKDFAPEPFSELYQRSLYQSMYSLTSQTFQLLRRRLDDLAEVEQELARKVLDLQSTLVARFQEIIGRRVTAMRTRCHGDYHLGQVLHTGKDFVIFDFEGDPERPLSERRLKRSPLRDVAGMLCSFHYAAYAALFQQETSGVIHAEDMVTLEPWIRFWKQWVCAAFLKSYRETAAGASFLPQEPEDFQLLLNSYLLEKTVADLGRELSSRPSWVSVPLRGILQLLEDAPQWNAHPARAAAELAAQISDSLFQEIAVQQQLE
ncbi:MAG TPA: putative maltokinase, partial [Dehalococcoidia bacterium]|nr:putative maltokinase [Dehalococcoidia bacterium]